MGFDLDRTLALAQQTQDRRMRFAALQQLQKERRMLDLHSRAEQFEENPQLLKHRLALRLELFEIELRPGSFFLDQLPVIAIVNEQHSQQCLEIGPPDPWLQRDVKHAAQE